MKKSIIHIKLPNWPSLTYSNSKHNANGGGFDNRTEDVGIVVTRPLGASDHGASLVGNGRYWVGGIGTGLGEGESGTGEGETEAGDEKETGDRVEEEGEGGESTVTEEVVREWEIPEHEGERTRSEPQAMGGDASCEIGMTKSCGVGVAVEGGTGDGKAGRGAEDGAEFGARDGEGEGEAELMEG
ncbi:hypothetical protein SLEP1_g55317 [Rubroshorea leprosula]|nr:hypothetical protein SLEP1_g55317 [Rubroshorea leprosula]